MEEKGGGWLWFKIFIKEVAKLVALRFARDLRLIPKDSDSHSSKVVLTYSNTRTGAAPVFPEVSEQEKESSVQSFVYLFSVIKEAAREFGYKVTADDVTSINTEKVLERTISDTVKEVGSLPESEIGFARSVMRSFGKFVIPLLAKVASTAVPTVPAYVSPQTYAEISEGLEKMFRRRASDNLLKDPRLIPALEALVDKWNQEAKPETYTKPITFAIQAIWKIRLERNLLSEYIGRDESIANRIGKVDIPTSEKSAGLVTFCIVDGSNVCRAWGSTTSLAILLTLLNELRKKGIVFSCIFDANIRHKLDTNDRPVYEQLIAALPDYFTEVTGGIRADDFILLRADSSNSIIVSNDRFRDKADRYTWLESSPERLIKGNVVGRNLVVPALNIDVSLNDNLAFLAKELQNALMKVPDDEKADMNNPVFPSTGKRVVPLSEINDDESTLVRKRERD